MTNTLDFICPAEFTRLAAHLADLSGPIARRYFRAGLAVDDKADSSPVTKADREIETALRACIEERFPDHGVIGEEHGAHNPDVEFVWVIDPIDGTKSFVTGKPLFGTLIALTRWGRPVLGVIDHPALNERWIGGAGLPTTFNGAPANVRACAELADAFVTATSPDMFTASDRQSFDRLDAATKHTLYGTDCYGYGLLASGHLDLVVEAQLQTYDFCALAPVIEAAGGLITDWQGQPLTLGSDGRVVAAGDPACHSAALQRLSGAMPLKSSEVGNA